jgi:hypothetical protein
LVKILSLFIISNGTHPLNTPDAERHLKAVRVIFQIDFLKRLFAKLPAGLVPNGVQ